MLKASITPRRTKGWEVTHIAQVEPERLLAALAASSQELVLEPDSGTQDEDEHDGHYGRKGRPRGAEWDGLTCMGLGGVVVNDAGYAEQAEKGQEGAGKTTDPNQSGADRIESCRRDRKQPTGEVSGIDEAANVASADPTFSDQLYQRSAQKPDNQDVEQNACQADRSPPCVLRVQFPDGRCPVAPVRDARIEKVASRHQEIESGKEPEGVREGCELCLPLEPVESTRPKQDIRHRATHIHDAIASGALEEDGGDQNRFHTREQAPRTVSDEFVDNRRGGIGNRSHRDNSSQIGAFAGGSWQWRRLQTGGIF
jgi:hypothetical protein